MRGSAWIGWAVATALLLVLNLLTGYIPLRLDLTEERRFTVTEATERIVAEVEDPLFVEVLLEGDFPAGFRRLRAQVEGMLVDFGTRNPQIQYVFRDPSDGSIEQVNLARKQLAEQGIEPVNFQVQDVDGRSDRLLYPYAVLKYRNQTAVVNLLESNVPGVDPEIVLNNSVSLLEYKLANAIQKLLRSKRPLVAFTTGHGELTELQTRDLANALAPYYQVGRVRLDSMGGFGPEDVGCLIVAKPQGAFNDREKFIIDQYVMRGGKLMLMLDRFRVNLDSLRGKKDFIPDEYQLNLEDLLFKYGLRVEPNLVLDLQSTRIPLVVGQLGNAPQFDLRPWPYHVLATPNPGHPITRSLQPVDLYFPSQIDLSVRTRTQLDKTVLLSSSNNALIQFAPVRLDLESARYDLDPARFDEAGVPIAVLAQGTFPSLYENRVSTEFATALREVGQSFRAESEPTKLILVADGDVAKNAIDPAQNAFRPLGLNPFEKYVFDNKDFLLNSIEYLFDEGGILAARNREVKLRLLNTARARTEATYWRALNLGGPLLLVAGFAALYGYIRRRRYAHP